MCRAGGLGSKVICCVKKHATRAFVPLRQPGEGAVAPCLAARSGHSPEKIQMLCTCSYTSECLRQHNTHGRRYGGESSPLLAAASYRCWNSRAPWLYNATSRWLRAAISRRTAAGTAGCAFWRLMYRA